MKIELSSGYHIKKNKHLDHWSPMIEEWLLLVERYARVTNGKDAPFLHKELANVSVLAAAAFKAGWVAIQETTIDKSDGFGDTYKGRADLLLISGRSNRHDQIEAKYDRSIYPGNKSTEIGSEINSAFDAALRDSLDVCEEEGIGLVFWNIRTPVDPRTRKFESVFVKLISQRIEDSKGVVAWCFPQCMRNYSKQSPREKVYFRPGVIMIAERASNYEWE